MPNDDLTHLVELANKATRGIWIAVGRWVENVHDDLPDIVTTTEDRGPNDSDKQQCADAAYIAAVNPSAVKRLIDEIRSLRAVVQAGAVPLTPIRQAALDLYTPPFRHEHGYIRDANHEMVADDAGSEGSGLVASRIRGWGRIQYMNKPELLAAVLQDEVAEMVAEALNAYWAARGRK